MKILNKLLFKLILFCPYNWLRIFIYKNVFGYKIGQKVRIGKSIIKCNDVFIGDNVIIGDQNQISCNKLILKTEARILSNNSIVGKSDFTLGVDSRIISRHYVDCWNSVTLGDRTWLAGQGSQIWTHGSIHTKTGKNLEVKLGDDIYVGSNTLFAPGVVIGNDCLIGLGSVITKSIEVENVLISGNPARLVKENINWRKNW